MARVARLGIVIDASGAKRGADETNAALRSIEGTAKRAEDTLKKAAGALGIAFGVRSLQQAVDTYSQLEGRLRLVTRSSQELARVQADLFRVAQSTRQSYEGTVDLYTRLARSAGEIGLSQQDLVTLTERVGQALVVSGSNSVKAAGALTQLGQAFSAGTVRAEEFNSILEGAPRLAQAVADSLGITVGQLRQMVVAGELSSKALADGIKNSAALAKEFGQITPTIGGALTELNNAFGVVVAGSGEAQSASKLLAGGISESARFMVEYRDAVVAVSVALGVGGLTMAATKAGAALLATSGGATVSALLALVPAVNSVSAAMALLRLAAAAAWTAITGPVGLAVAGFAAVTAALYLWIRRQKEVTPEVQATAKSVQELYVEARKLAEVSFVPKSALDQLTELNTLIQIARKSGAQNADAYKAASEEWSRSGKSAKTFAQALADGDAKAQNYLGTFQAIAQNQQRLTRITDAQTKAQRDAAKVTEERAKIEADYQAQVVQLGIELADRARMAQDEYAAAVKAANTALTTQTLTRTKDVDAIRAQVVALSQGALAYREVIEAQQLQAAVTEALNAATAQGIVLTPQQTLFLVAQVKEYQRLAKVKEALLGLDGQNPFIIPVEETREWASTLNEVATAAQRIGQVFGQVGSAISKAVQLAAQVVESLAAVRQTSAALEKARGTSGEGKAQSAFNAAQASSVLSVTTAVVSGISAWVQGARQSAEEARQLAIALREARAAAKANASAFVAGANQSPLERELSSITGQFNDVIRELLATGAPRVERLGPRTARSVVPTAADVNAVIDAYEQLIAKAKEAAAFQLQQAQTELAARLLIAQGREAEGEALRLEAKQAKEIREAEEQYGKDSPYLMHLKEVLKAELEAAQAAEARRQIEKNRARDDIGFDIAGRRQTLDGDARGAFVTRQNAGAARALREAQDLFDAGTITAEMFAELTRIINDELTQAIRDFDQAAAEAAAQAQAAAAAAEQERLAGIQRAQTAIIKEMIDAYKVLDPQLAASLEQQQKTIDRNERLANATDDVTRAQLAHLFALQDEAEAQIAAAQAAEAAARAFERQTEAARKFAEIGMDAEERYLRATGKTFEADAKRRKRERDAQLAEAAQAFGALGLTINPNSPNFIQQIQQFAAQQAEFKQITDYINGAYDADMAALIAAQMNGSATPGTSGAGGASGGAFGSPGRAADIPVLGGESVTMRSAASMTETSATRLIDFASAQLSVQREILAELRGRRSQSSDLLGPAFVDRLDRAFGTRAADSALLLNGRVS